MLADEHCTNAPWDTFPRWHRHAETVYLPQTFPARGNHTTGKSSPPDQAGSCRVHTVLLIAHSPVEPCTHLLFLPLLQVKRFLNVYQLPALDLACDLFG